MCTPVLLVNTFTSTLTRNFTQHGPVYRNLRRVGDTPLILDHALKCILRCPVYVKFQGNQRSLILKDTLIKDEIALFPV